MHTEEISEKMQHASNRHVALLIAILALALALFESLAKSYQTESLSLQMESVNLWSFYQAKSIKAHTTDLAMGVVIEVADKYQMTESEAIKKWSRNVELLNSNETEGDGKLQLLKKAKEVEKERDLMFIKYRYMEIASGLLQVAIVLASAAIITNVGLLVLGSILLGGGATAVGGIGMFVPTLF